MSDTRHLEADVAIVGYGPVGQALAAVLGRAGHSVVVFERFQEIYRLPRAVHLDHEIMRLLQPLGLADALAQEMIPVHNYQWFGADGEPLLRFDLHGPARSGWQADYMFFQPELEAALARRPFRRRRRRRVPAHRGGRGPACAPLGRAARARRRTRDDGGFARPHGAPRGARPRRTPGALAGRPHRARRAGAPRLLRLRQRPVAAGTARAARRPPIPLVPHPHADDRRTPSMTDARGPIRPTFPTSTSRPPACRR
jgi:choline dehydrogenase-like flavoprotein